MARGTVKICSLREIEHAEWVAASEADHFGLIFAPARRQVTIQRAAEIIAAVASASVGRGPAPVGVFVDQNIVVLNNIVDALGLAIVQLHGEESAEYVEHVQTPVLKAIRPKPDETFDAIARRMDSYRVGRQTSTTFLVEGFHPDHAGGQGVRADWEMARRLAERFPMVLAGGLTPESVGLAIEAVAPLGVDVSSGVESAGLKDHAKIVEFVTNARAAYTKGNR